MIRMVAGNEDLYPRVIQAGHVRAWVGIGWVDEGPVPAGQEDLYPTVID